PYCHAGAYLAADGVSLVAAADIVPEKAVALAEKWAVPKTYVDYRDMIQEERPDIVSVTTRPDTHAEVAIFAAENGARAVYCEKPMCCSMEEADAIRAACEKHGVVLNLGSSRRYQEAFWRIREQVTEGVIGDVQLVVSYSSGGALWTHTHTTDILLFLAGDPTVVSAQGAADLKPEERGAAGLERDPQILSAAFEFGNGVRGVMTRCAGYEFEVHGSRGKIRTRGNGHAFETHVFDEHGRATSANFPAWARSTGSVNCIHDLVSAIKDGTTPIGGVDVAVRGQEMSMAVVESERRDGARVQLPLGDRSLYVRGW
ncbi:Gfo/Idh/MocA family oxidoreductase, partial [Candidatus Poribacteria bacterium]|nr:Gfo/Idh/MocA family oxidoreductase [Candidatus Poribacteria bacterium]